ncbi:MAG: heat-inducible transcriptional repressor HrcA [Thermodesulfobacteriota bacterium]
MSLSSERSRKILSAVVQDYIHTAEPVSSRAIATKYALGLSPATIRYIMAELESEGFLYQPHTSAGRVPTDKSFRMYVDSLQGLDEPLDIDKELLKKSFESFMKADNVLSDAAKALSTLTSCAGLMFVPRKDNFLIRAISFLVLDSTTLMMVLQSSFGAVQTRLIRLGTEVGKLDMERITNYLNEIAGGLTVRELRGRIVEEMKNDKNRYDRLLSNALKLGAAAFEQEGTSTESDLYVEGKVNIFDQPEFRDDFESMKKLFSAFEEKSLLVKILDKSLEAEGIHIYLGSESAIKEFEGLSIITAPYTSGGTVLGTIGVMGPVRMDYPKIIPLVDYTAGLLSKLL